MGCDFLPFFPSNCIKILGECVLSVSERRPITLTLDVMSNRSHKDESVTDLLRQAADGRANARAELYNLIYDDMREAAHRVMQGNYRGDFQTTALVHESLLRFEKNEVLEKYSANRRVFFSVAIQAMQQILVDHYRRRNREAQPSDNQCDPFQNAVAEIETQTGVDFSVLNKALDKLKHGFPRQHSVIVHRFFGGLTIPQTAELLEVSQGTIERDWRLARAKLRRILQDSPEE